MKTRIKVTTRFEDGVYTSLYQAQFKDGLFVWKPALPYIRKFSANVSAMCGAERGELAFAQKVIDILLADHAVAERLAAVERSKKVTYIDYP